jgi:tRNA1Val (adenine37-N6)-methyltransferase
VSNNFFRFKQFTIHQDRCAMKVCTDACLFGALASKSSQLAVQSVLDIGTGTGLLSLMYAQKNGEAAIDAVEIDERAARQAKENFNASPWKERLNVYHTSIQQFHNLTDWPISLSTKYNVILSNPPFYENDLKSKSEKRNLALHSCQLTLEELFDAAFYYLTNEGIFAVLLPYNRMKECTNLATGLSFHLSKKVLVKQTPKHTYFRSILWFTKQPAITEELLIVIQNEEGKYTNEFIALLKDYYLYL